MTINEEMNVEEFVKRIKDSIDRNPENKYLFFIGAGCSIPSEIPGAAKLTRQWLDELKELSDPNEYSKWYEKNIGLGDVPNIAKFYSTVIKKRFPIKPHRQQEMERLIDRGKESFGYVVLAHLLTSTKYGKNFNIVFTTNFDNLIAESIYRYTSEKVRIISHDSLMSFVNTYSTKPQIVKLHGDVEFEPKTTKDETFRLNDEALEIVKHTLTNCGLIFIGYGGNDKSIINSLEQISKKSITNGIFWVNDALPKSKLKDWLDSREHSYWIKHNDFDLLMMYFMKFFNIPRPDKKRCLDAEIDFEKSLKDFSNQIEDTDSPKKNQYREILKKYVSSVDDWISLSMEADEVSKTDFPKAVGLYEEGIKKFKNNSNLFTSFGNLYSNNKKYEDAIQCYDDALKITPDHVGVLNNKGNALSDLEKYEDAIQCYDAALKIKPDYVEALNNKGIALSDLEKYEDAIQYYDAAFKIKPDYVEALNSKGIALSDLGRYEDAIQCYDAALKIKPDYDGVLINKGTVLSKLEKYEDAMQCYDAALKIKPDYDGAFYNKSCVYSLMDKVDLALEFLGKSIHLDSKYKEMAKTDSDFDRMKNNSKFSELIR